MFSLRAKLLIPTLITTLLMLGSIAYIALLEYNIFKKQVESELNTHKTELISEIKKLSEDTGRLANALVEDWRIIDSILLGDKDALLDLIMPFHEGLHFDMVTVYDHLGRIIGRADNPHQFGITDELLPDIKQALNSLPDKPLFKIYQGKLMLISLQALKADVHGVSAIIAVGYEFDQLWLHAFGEKKHNHFSITLKYGDILFNTRNLEHKQETHSTSQESDHIYEKSFSLSKLLITEHDLLITIEEHAFIGESFWDKFGTLIIGISLFSGLLVLASHQLMTKTVYSLNKVRKSAVQSAKKLAETAKNLEQARDRAEQVAEELRASQTRFQVLTNTSPNGIFQANPEGACIYANQRWYEISGFSEKESLGQGWTKALHPEDQERLVQSWLKTVETRQPWKEEGRLLRPDGEVRWALIKAALELNRYGEINSFVGNVADITERKNIELELQLAKEKAEAANQAKSAFLANMSHELRTPLNGILGYTQILQRERSLTIRQKEGVELIHRSGEHLLTLINDILDLSKIEAGRMELYTDDFALGSFLKDIIEMFKIRTQQKSIELSYEAVSILPDIVHADEKRLRQLLMNLMGNAVKFTEKGYVNLQLRYDFDSQYLQVDIVDTGCGIADDQLNEVFSPFRQVGSILHKAQGTGLGLSITKRLVEMMEGEIGVESEAGKGSRFWFKIHAPFSRNRVESKQINEFEHINGYVPAGNHLAYRILIVDDTNDNILVTKNLLEPLGFETDQAVNGHEAIEKAHLCQPDLILMDLMMPILDGFEATRRLRQETAFQNTPIIAISASVFSEHMQASHDAGCTDFLPKPFKAELLFACLEKYLPLTWVYEEKTNVTDLVTKQTNVPEIELNSEQAKHLLEFARMGDVMAIHNYLDELQTIEPGLYTALKKIRTLAKDFDDDSIIEMVQPYCK